MRLCLFCLSILVSGCSTLTWTQYAPQVLDMLSDTKPVYQEFTATHFISSEANGKAFHGTAGMALAGGNKVRLINDMDELNSATDLKMESGFDFDLTAQVGLHKKVDLVFSDGLGLKVQLSGPSAQEAAKDDVSVSLTAISIWTDSSESTSDSTGAVKDAEADFSGSGTKLLLTLGKRLKSNSVLYGGPFFSKIDLDKVTLFQSNNSGFSNTTVVNGGEGRSYGANVGYMFDTDPSQDSKISVLFAFEVAYSHTDWERTFPTVGSEETKDSVHAGSAVSIRW
jgi:hypothetical protein